MSMLIHIITFLVCFETVYVLPIQEDSSFGENIGLRLAKRPFYPYRDAILSPFGFFENPRETSQGQRKKAVDSTFIRFGRSSPSESRNVRDLQAVSSSMEQQPKLVDMEMSENADTDGYQVTSPRFLLNHNGCKVANSRELMKALLNDPNCIRAFQKAKRENVNDTFIGFGKREAPNEPRSDSDSSRIGDR